MDENNRANIVVCLRDINGKRTKLKFDYFYEAYMYFYNCIRKKEEEEEILYVTIDDACVYSSLNDSIIFYEDLIGFFA